MPHVSHLLATLLSDHSVRAHHADQPVATGHSGGNSMLPLEVILVLVGVVIGRIWGRRAGLKHLGEAEFRTRMGLVRRTRRF